jgi:uncharacterized repeat protein (TIGR01451 family)
MKMTKEILKFIPITGGAMFRVPPILTGRIRKTLSMFGLGLALSGITAFSTQAAGGSLKMLHGHVPAGLSGLQALGSLPATTNLNLAIGLPLRNQEALTNLLQQIYDPASPNYHHYLTPDEFTAQFGPAEQDYQAVKNFAAANGLTVIGTHPNRMLLNVSGKASDVEKAFQVKLRTYQHPTEAREFFAPDTEPVLDASLPIIHVSGLDNYFTASPMLRARPFGQPAGTTADSVLASGASPNLGSAPGGNYQGKDFRNAYVPGTTLTGAGQNVGLLQFDAFYASDIVAYENQIGLTSNVPNLVVVPVDGGVPAPTPFGNPEVSLDIEMVLSMSPGVSNIYVYEGPNSSALSIYTIFEDVLSRMADDNFARQLSCSWYIYEGPPDPVAEQIFQQMALQGQTFFSASGDADAYTGLIPFPCDSPHITLVGGTTLTTGSSASYMSETVWNWGNEFGSAYDGIGSSGGISTFYSIPVWQTNINFTTSHGSATRRNVPDVALTADHVWVIYGAGSSDWFGGTSCAAPLWAGFTALVNQQATNNGHSSAGFINPAIYAIASGTNYGACFHDITTGNNAWSGSPTLFYAVSGYDLCTGLGTPNGTNLINALTTGTSNTFTHISPPPPPYGTNLAALNGGNPNGTWELFVQDDQPFDVGIISNGWILTLTMASPVGETADNQLLMTASSTNIVVGGSVTYGLTVTNYGPSASTNVQVSDSMPSGFTLDPSSSSTVGSITRSGSTVIWNIDVLATNAGGRATLTMQAHNAGNFFNSAIVRATTPDLNPDDDFASTNITVGVVTPPLLSVVVVNTNGMFQFTITNSGANQTNVIQASTNLVNWIPIFTNVGSFTFTNAIDPNYPFRFYRDYIPGP